MGLWVTRFELSMNPRLNQPASSIECIVWSMIVVVVHPLLSHSTNLLEILEQIRIQNVPPETAIEPLYVCILSRLSRLDELECDTLLFTPQTQ